MMPRTFVLLVTLLLPAGLLPTPAPALAPAGPSFEGRWQGYIVISPSEDEVDFVIDLSRRPDGSLEGKMSIPSQGARDVPLSDIAVDGSTISFVYRDSAGVSLLSGRLSEDGSMLTGEHLEQGQTYPLRLARTGRAGGADDPPNPAVVDLPGIPAFKDVFNRDRGKTRLLMILSPGCESCLDNARMVKRYVLEKVTSPDLRVYVVWSHVGNSDTRQRAEAATWFIADPRVTHFWAADTSLGEVFGPSLGLQQGPVWDVFLVFGPSAVWNETVPAPDDFMHRRRELPQARRFNGSRLAETIVNIARRSE